MAPRRTPCAELAPVLQEVASRPPRFLKHAQGHRRECTTMRLLRPSGRGLKRLSPSPIRGPKPRCLIPQWPNPGRPLAPSPSPAPRGRRVSTDIKYQATFDGRIRVRARIDHTTIRAAAKAAQSRVGRPGSHAVWVLEHFGTRLATTILLVRKRPHEDIWSHLISRTRNFLPRKALSAHLRSEEAWNWRRRISVSAPCNCDQLLSKSATGKAMWQGLSER